MYCSHSLTIALFQWQRHSYWLRPQFVRIIFECTFSQFTFILNIFIRCYYHIAGILTFINCYDVKFTTKLQNLFMFTKIAALVIVIIIGVYYMSTGEWKLSIKCLSWLLEIHFNLFWSTGHMENFDKPFENTETDPGKLSIAFYSGIFSYAGWYVLNGTHFEDINRFISN